jgi:subtilisin family serine protease
MATNQAFMGATFTTGAVLTGVLADASLLVIGAFHRRKDGDAADVFDLVTAMDRGATVASVINMSLAGPPNALLERAGATLAARGVTVVAAAGNDGANSPPRYPAAYPWAIAVTAVDASKRAYRKAVRGSHISFAAPGVSLRLPWVAGEPQTVSGTSFAAPLVAAALLAIGEAASGRRGGDSVGRLAAAVEDLGAPGRDPIYGWGLVQVDAVCADRAAP